MSLLVFGTIALDDVKTPAGIKKNMLGGSAAHFSMSARLFTDVHLVGVIGRDFPRAHLTLLRQKRINTESLTLSQGASFHWEGEYKKENLNAAITHKTDLGVLSQYVPTITKDQRELPYVFLANYDPDSQMRMLSLMKKPQLIGLDSMNLWITHYKKSLLSLVGKVNLFVLNDGEARMLTGESNLIQAAKCLKRLGPAMVVIKKGEHGVLFYSSSFSFCFPAYPVERVVDPTGAGDTFAGGVMGYLSHKKRLNPQVLKEAAIYATVLASFNVEGFGMSKTAALTLPAVNQRVKKFLKFISP